MDKPATLQQLHQEFVDIAGRGAKLAELLEKGQADTPLANHFRQLLMGLESAPFSVILLGLTQEARTRVLAWFTGQDYTQLSVTVSQQSGLVHVQLREQGYSFHKSGFPPQTFDRLEPFIEAMKEADLLREGDAEAWVDPLRLGMQAAKGVQSFDIYMVENVAQLHTNPALLSRLIAQANTLILAAEESYSLSSLDKAILGDLLPQIIAVWPVNTRPEASPGVPHWCSFLKQADLILPLTPLVPNSELPPFLTRAHDTIRIGLFLAHNATIFQQAVATLNSQYQQESRQLTTRIQRENRKLKQIDGQHSAQSHRKGADTLRTGLDIAIEKLSESLRENARKQFLPSSDLARSIRQQVEGICVDDLQQTEAYREITLTLKDQSQQRLSEQIRDNLRHCSAQMVTHLREQVGKLVNDTEWAVQQTIGVPVAVSHQHLDDQKVWAALHDAVHLDIRYKGTVPKRGLVHRLGEGRKWVFMLLMTLSLVGTMAGFNWRAMWFMGWIFLFVFVGAFVYTFLSWRKEDESRLEKELDRIHENLLSEVRRSLQDSQRELTAQLAQYLDKTRRDLQRQVEQMLLKLSESQGLTVEQQRRDGQQKKQVLNARQQRLGEQQMPLQQLGQDTEKLFRACIAWLRHMQE